MGRRRDGGSPYGITPRRHDLPLPCTIRGRGARHPEPRLRGEGPRGRTARHLEVISKPSARRAAEVGVAVRDVRRIGAPFHERRRHGCLAARILHPPARHAGRSVAVENVCECRVL